MDFDCDQANKTFSNIHGVALAEQTQRLCGVGEDFYPPQIHILLAKGASGPHGSALDLHLHAPVLLSELSVDMDFALVATS